MRDCEGEIPSLAAGAYVNAFKAPDRAFTQPGDSSDSDIRFSNSPSHRDDALCKHFAIGEGCFAA